MIVLPLLASLLTGYQCQRNPPSLAGDTRVNTLLSLNAKHGGLRRLDPSSELVREHPPGSGRWVTVDIGIGRMTIGLHLKREVKMSLRLPSGSVHSRI